MFRLYRRFKAYLWSLVAQKVERYARCRQCQELVEIYTADDAYTSALRDHLGHSMEGVNSINLTEWVRVFLA